MLILLLLLLHHSGASYGPQRVVVEGTVVRAYWGAPHLTITTQEWKGEGRLPLRGEKAWSGHVLRTGDRIKAEGYAFLYVKNELLLTKITFADGSVLDLLRS